MSDKKFLLVTSHVVYLGLSEQFRAAAQNLVVDPQVSNSIIISDLFHASLTYGRALYLQIYLPMPESLLSKKKSYIVS
jgi:hypothetical protein